MKNNNLAFLLLFPFLFSCNQATKDPNASQLVDNPQTQKTGITGAATIVFKSADGGETWQNISEGPGPTTLTSTSPGTEAGDATGQVPAQPGADGCACRSDPAAPSSGQWLALGLLGLLGLGARRRRADARH